MILKVLFWEPKTWEFGIWNFFFFFEKVGVWNLGSSVYFNLSTGDGGFSKREINGLMNSWHTCCKTIYGLNI